MTHQPMTPERRKQINELLDNTTPTDQWLAIGFLLWRRFVRWLQRTIKYFLTAYVLLVILATCAAILAARLGG